MTTLTIAAAAAELTTVDGITLAAELTKVGGGYIVDITVVDARYGKRALLDTIAVAGKREARKVAAAHGATPWNF